MAQSLPVSSGRSQPRVHVRLMAWPPRITSTPFLAACACARISIHLAAFFSFVYRCAL